MLSLNLEELKMICEAGDCKRRSGSQSISRLHRPESYESSHDHREGRVCPILSIIATKGSKEPFYLFAENHLHGDMFSDSKVRCES
jgi:hypothetical protein